jgi:hypothetical protein
MFELSPLVVFERSWQTNVWNYMGGEITVKFLHKKVPDFNVAFRDLLHAVNLRHGSDGFTFPS